MLNKREKLVMQLLFDCCNNNGGKCLMSAKDIAGKVYSRIDLTEFEIDEIVKNLIMDDYIDVIYSNKKGQIVYCITLKSKGVAFKREKHNSKVNITMLVVRTILLAVLSFVVGVVLKKIFS